MSEVFVGQIVMVRNRTRPAGYQVYPAIVTAVQDEDETPLGFVSVNVTGFPGGGAQYTDNAIGEIDVQSESVIGWYSTQDEAARPKRALLGSINDRGPASNFARQKAAQQSDVLVQHPNASIDAADAPISSHTQTVTLDEDGNPRPIQSDSMVGAGVLTHEA